MGGRDLRAYRGEPAGRRLDIRRLRELDVRGTVPETIDTETREGDQELLLASILEVHSQDSMADLLDDDAAAREAGLLRGVALESKTLGRVADVIRGDGWVVRDLLDDKVGLATTVLIGPETVEQPTQRGRGFGDGSRKCGLAMLTLQERGSAACVAHRQG